MCLGWFAYFPVALQESSTDLCCNPVAEFETTEAEDAVLSCLCLLGSFSLCLSSIVGFGKGQDSDPLFSQSAQVRGTRFQTSFDYDYDYDDNNDNDNDNDNENENNNNDNNNMRIEIWVSAFTRIAMLIDAITNRVQGKGLRWRLWPNAEIQMGPRRQISCTE